MQHTRSLFPLCFSQSMPPSFMHFCDPECQQIKCLSFCCLVSRWQAAAASSENVVISTVDGHVSRCQQIKVFVFRLSCRTLSLVSPVLSPCVSYFISPSSLNPLSPVFGDHPLTCDASRKLKFSPLLLLSSSRVHEQDAA